MRPVYMLRQDKLEKILKKWNVNFVFNFESILSMFWTFETEMFCQFEK